MCYTSFQGVDSMKKHKYSEKQLVLDAYKSGKPVAEIVMENGIPRSTIYSWIKQSSKQIEEQKVTQKTLKSLESKIARLNGIIEIMKKSYITV